MADIKIKETSEISDQELINIFKAHEFELKNIPEWEDSESSPLLRSMHQKPLVEINSKN